MTALTDKQFDELKVFLSEQQKDLITYSHVSKDKEISNLHREILKKIETLDTKISSHDEMIKVVTEMLPELKQAVGAYKNSSIISKAVIGFVLGVPALAGCVAGIIYLVGLFSLKQ